MNWAYIWCGMFVLMLAWHIVERRLIVRTCKKNIDAVVDHAEIELKKFVQEVTEKMKTRTHKTIQDLYMEKLKGSGHETNLEDV